jgi:hypothetical protein
MHTDYSLHTILCKGKREASGIHQMRKSEKLLIKSTVKYQACPPEGFEVFIEDDSTF